MSGPGTEVDEQQRTPTFSVSEGTEGSSGAAAALLHVVALCGLVDLRTHNTPSGLRSSACGALGDGPTSGWNCCSVLVWQYWHPSAPSHLLGSPHSSLCFTAGHGSALRHQEQHAAQTRRLRRAAATLDVSSTCTCACEDCAAGLCCCGNTGRRNLGDIDEGVSYRVLSCSGTAHSCCLRRRQRPRHMTETPRAPAASRPLTHPASEALHSGSSL